ncbi:methylation site containing protein [Shewanella sp. OPT22]|nr:methylation site containing protein [Shewanella sp. OPT22]
MKTKQQGFTLIELVVVIIILGILAVTAAPKFLDFEKDAKEATIKGLEGTLKSADALVYSKAVIKGVENLASTDAKAIVDSVKLNFGHSQAEWADALTNALEVSASKTDTNTDWAFDDTTDNVIYFYPQGEKNPNGTGTDKGTCFVKYENSLTTSDGKFEVTSDTSGC